jgi:hypothetical protein
MARVESAGCPELSLTPIGLRPLGPPLGHLFVAKSRRHHRRLHARPWGQLLGLWCLRLVVRAFS